MRTFLCGVLLLCAFPVLASEDAARIISENKEVVVPKCAKDHTCDLKQVGFWAQQYRVGSGSEKDVSDQSYGAALYAWYETNSLHTLENYAFVQFIRGCVFETHFVGLTRTVEYSFVRRHLDPNKRALFFHPEWAFDSDDKDPVYGSYAETPNERHFLTQWNEYPEIFPDSQGTLYGEEKPKVPRLFVTDYPTQAMLTKYNDGSIRALNVSLEFRMCMYREKDVPKEANESTVIAAAPIACFAWRNSYIFNNQTQVFDSPQEIVSECKGKIPRTPFDKVDQPPPQ